MSTPTVPKPITKIAAPKSAPVGIVSAQAVTPITADASKEYVSGGSYLWVESYVRALPFYIDDTTRDFGDDLYDRMLLDAQVQSSLSSLKSGVLADGWRLTAVGDTDEDERQGVGQKPSKAPSDLSKEIADTCRRWILGLQRPFDDVLFEMLDALAFGNKVAELVWDDARGGDDAGKLVLAAIKVKPRRALAFVVDSYTNIVGIVGLIPGQAAPVIVNALIAVPGQKGTTPPNLLPREKFAVLTWQAKAGDPRGSSCLRCVYDPWWFKQQIKADYLRFLSQFGSPSLAGFTAPDAQPVAAANADGSPVLDENNNPLSLTPEEAMANAMAGYANSTVGVYPNGAEVKVLFSPSTGEAFGRAFDYYDRQITTGILNQTLATMEGKHQARAASETHQDVMGSVVDHGKRAVVQMVTQDILRTMVRYNWGEDAARDLTPEFTLGNVEQQDFAANATAIAALTTSGYLHPSQFPALDTEMGLPQRDMMQVNAEQQAKQALTDAQVKTANNPASAPSANSGKTTAAKFADSDEDRQKLAISTACA